MVRTIASWDTRALLITDLIRIHRLNGLILISLLILEICRFENLIEVGVGVGVLFFSFLFFEFSLVPLILEIKKFSLIEEQIKPRLRLGFICSSIKLNF